MLPPSAFPENPKTPSAAEQSCQNWYQGLSAVVDKLEEMILSFDNLHKKVLFVSAACRQITGFTQAEHVEQGTLWIDIIHPEDKAEFESHYKDLFLGQKVCVNYRILTKNKECRWISSTLISTLNAQGELSVVDCISKDITDRKMVEARLQANLAVDEGIRGSEASVFAISIGGELLTFNQSYAERHKALCGVFPKRGDNYFKFLDTYGNEQWRKLLEKARAGERSLIESDKLIDGQVRRYRASIKPVFSRGHVSAITCFITDITDKEGFEKNIFRTKASLNAIINNTKDAIFSVDRNYRLLVLNEAFKEASFLVSGIHRRVGDLFFIEEWSPDVNGMWKQNLDRALAGEQFQITTVTEINGKKVEMEVSFNPIRENDIVTGVGCFARDITEQHGREEKLKASESRFRYLTEHSSDLKAMVDRQGRVSYISPAITRALGYTFDELKRLPLLDLIAVEDREAFSKEITRAVGRAAVPHFTAARVRTKEGGFVWLEGTVSNLLDTDGVNCYIVNCKDISAQKISELKLHQSEKNYRTLFENNPVPMWVVDRSLKCMKLNNAAVKMFGYPETDMLGVSILSLCAGSAQERLQTYLLETRERLILPLIVEMRTRNGATLIAELSTGSVEDNSAEALLIITNDVSSRIESEEKLRTTNERYELATRATNDAIWDWNLEEDTIYWGRRYSKLFGYEAGFNTSSLWAQHIHPDDRDRVIKKLEAALANPTDGAWEDEYRYIKSDATVANVYDRGFIIFDLEGKPQRMVGAMQDFTKRKADEERLRQSEANLRTIFENAHIGFVLLDNEFKVVSCNQLTIDICEKALHRTLREGDSYLDFVPRSRRKLMGEKLRRARAGEKVQYEGQLKLMDESIAWYEINAFPVNDNTGGTLGVILSIDDVTAKKAVDIERERITLDLMQRNSTLEQFAYIISHNLRSPVANITGLCQLILSEKLTQKDYDKCIDGLATSVKMLDEVIIDLNHILQVRREINEKKENVTLSRLLSDVAASINNLIEKEKVEIVADFSSVDSFFTLKSYLHSIFYNLVSNSIKYRHPARNPRIEVKGKKIQNRLQLIFRDNGLGIDLKTHGDKIFGLYKKFHTHADGKGMGLFMVKTQVEILGGTIRVKSMEHVGTQFSIEFDV